ncbi:MAG TPA: hypothetical protein VKA31_07830 [Mariprofundaceae bacterium]|nr:hypothetical protein [Mariprofundaceae bacterium]
MEAWLSIVLRQLILYSLPVLISLTLISLLESRLIRKPLPHAFFSVSWRGTWLPLLASIVMHRGMIIAPARPLQHGCRAAAIRLAGHLALTALGFLLFAWSLHHQAPVGLPPLHHWWAKVLMFYNLCMAALHLLPLPGQLVGESIAAFPAGQRLARHISDSMALIILTVLAATPLLDWILGGLIVFPVYAMLSGLADHLW